MQIRLHRNLAAVLAVTALAFATVTAAALPARAATLTVCASGCDYMTLAAANTAAVDGDTISLGAGEFAGVVTITKDVVITGVGNGADPASNTIIKGAGTGNALTLNPGAGKSVTVENLRITNFTTGVIVNSRITLQDVVVTDNASYGISINNGSTGLTILDSTFSLNGAAVKIGSQNSVSNVYIEGSHFDDNRSQGWYSDANGTTEPVLDGVTIKDSTFNNNPDKGFYTERLSNAVFQNVQFNNSGNGRATQGAGLDINLKWRTDYANISLINVTAVDSGKAGTTENGSGIAISGRNDGTTYGANPASLTGVSIDGAEISGATNGLYLGFAIAGTVSIEDSKLGGNTVSLFNDSTADVDATHNYWGSPAPDFAAIVVGDADVAPWWGDAAMTQLVVAPTADDPVITLPEGGEPITIVLPEDVEEPLIDVSELLGPDGAFTLEGDLTVVSPSGVVIEIPAGTTITPDDEEWDGLFAPPTVVEIDTVTPAGQAAAEVILAVKVGSDDVSFDVDPAVRLLLPGGKGYEVGFITPNGTFTQITTKCSADSQDAANAVARDCYIEVGDDIVVWTKHFTTFVVYDAVLAESGTAPSPLIPAVTALMVVGVGLFLIGRRRESMR